MISFFFPSCVFVFFLKFFGDIQILNMGQFTSFWSESAWSPCHDAVQTHEVAVELVWALTVEGDDKRNRSNRPGSTGSLNFASKVSLNPKDTSDPLVLFGTMSFLEKLIEHATALLIQSWFSQWVKGTCEKPAVNVLTPLFTYNIL